MQRIYLDYNATTPVDKEVSRAMQPYLEDFYGNPSSSHWFGIQTRKAIEKAREQVASLLNCESDEIIFTSGGTESNNFAILGSAAALKDRGRHIITTSVEHPAVLEVCRHLESIGYQVTYLPVDRFGMTDPAELKEAIRADTILISVMHANNEVGTIQPVEEIGRIAKTRGILFHTDAAQSAGKIPVDVKELGVDLLSLAGHKLYAPKGVGALYVRRGIRLKKLMYGADHEQDLRPGTENVLEIAGLGKACEIARRDLTANSGHFLRMRDRLHNRLKKGIGEIPLNGHPESRLPNTLSLSFPGIEANLILTELEDVAASAGAACHSDQVEMSHVLKAMQIPVEQAMGTIRFSTGKRTTEEEIDKAAERVVSVIRKLTSQPEPKSIKAESEVRLTHFTAGLGCACKLRPQVLEQLLREIPLSVDPRIMVGTGTSDDAAVYRLNEKTALVQTVDFFTPIVDDPYQFGAIAAANSLSDVYAMGAKPLFALNIVAFPSNRLPVSVLKKIISGARDKAAEAGIEIIGGHTVDDPEPKFGLVVLGSVHPDRVLVNSRARPGDAVVLTKPIGTGILATAGKRGLADDKHIELLVRTMSELNRNAAELMKAYDVSACTDVTGFGLIGHLKEITVSSKVDAVINPERVPVLEGVTGFIAANMVPGGTINNLEYVADIADWDDSVSQSIRILLCDAQTSGGLLICLPEEQADQLIADLHGKGILQASRIGYILKKGTGRIRIDI